MNNMELAIVAKIREKGGKYVSFAQLSHIDGFRGEHVYGCLDENILFWANISLEAANAMKHLVQDGIIIAEVTSPVTYYIDGEALALPIAKRDKTYKKEHWLPMTFSIAGEE